MKTFVKALRLPSMKYTALVAISAGLLGTGCAMMAGSSASTPTLAVMPQFAAADVPAVGPSEKPVDAPGWPASPVDTSLPGKGLGQHPMLFIGEGYNKIYLVNAGKVIWTYYTGKGGEYDDIWLLSNGDILYSRMSYAEEITPQKKVVWHRDAPPGTEIHTVQPIGLDKVLLVENGTPARMRIINKTTGATEEEHVIPDAGAGVHAQFRRFRMTAAGTYLAAFLQQGKVVEYDKDFNVLWTYAIPSPWAAVRLHNGNTLITDEKDKLTREVNSKGETVWEYRLNEVPAAIKFPDSQTCVRLANGNTMLCSRGSNGKACQLLEVTPDKQVVWALKDWADLGPATAVQILDDPGVPENPGDLQR